MWKNILSGGTILAAITAWLPQQAHAEAWGSAGGWDIASGDKYCVVAQEFEGKGGTEVGLALYIDGDTRLMVLNSEWSAKQGQKYDISFQIDGTIFEGAASTGFLSGSGKAGFVADFESGFAESFANGRGLTIKMGDSVVDDLLLKGTGVAIIEARRCVKSLAAKLAAAEKEQRRLEHIAQDPFQAATIKLTANQPVIPIGSISGFANTNDYPSRALQQEREGVVHYSLTVGVEGRVQKCDIVKSSGHADLDAQTCNQLTRRGRFSAATDENGNPKEAEYRDSVTWKIPK
jgi:TonB family protein